jgi:hypothetical protein
VKIETEGFPQGLPPGVYNVDAEYVYAKTGSEPIIKVKFRAHTPPAEPETEFLLVEVRKDAVDQVQSYLVATPAVRSVTAHNEDHPHGCCCQHCPAGGNCRD